VQVLLISHYFEPENGAPQRRWDALINEFLNAGHTIAVFCPPPHYPSGAVPEQYRATHRRGTVEHPRDGLRIERVGFLPHRGDILTRTADHVWTAASTVWAVRKALRRGAVAPDVIVATAPAMESILAAALLSRWSRAALVIEMRDAWPDLMSHVAGLRGKRGVIHASKRLLHGAITRLQQSAQHVVVTTESFAAVLRSRGVQNVTVVRNGTSPARYARIPTDVREGEGLRALYMGTLGRSQGLEVVIEAAAILRREKLPVQVRLVGHGQDSAHLRARARGLEEIVQIIPAVAKGDVMKHYLWADTIIVSLRRWPPFRWTVPSKLYELLAVGKHISGLVEGEAAGILSATGAGSVAPPGDARALAEMWRSLIENPLNRSISADGRAWVQAEVDYPALARRYLAVLGEAVASRAERPASARFCFRYLRPSRR
jgi:colanic acid biosynthesis glycosyl transferase WcaI